MLAIVDYGMGNLRSVEKGFEKVGHQAQIVSSPEEVRRADRLVLPGVGAFRDAIHEIKQKKLDDPIRDHIQNGKPFLGICLGLQLLFDVSYEDGEWSGLGVIPGKVVRFEDQPGLKIPHMGWNQLQETRTHPILNDIPDDAYFYFVHSYFVIPDDPTCVAARTDHGQGFTSIVTRDKLAATQFHPEKSQTQGLKILKNFATMS